MMLFFIPRKKLNPTLALVGSSYHL